MPFEPQSAVHYELYGEGRPIVVGLPLMASHAEIFGEASAPYFNAWMDMLGARGLVLVADYPSIGQSLGPPPEDMTADRVCRDLVTLADHAGFGRFTFIGYSWSGAVGLQLATRTDRVAALAIGGWPPLGGPYAAMLAAARARIGRVPASAMAILRSTDQYRQWSTFYESVQGWPEADAVGALTCPRLVFYGAKGNLVEEGHPVPIAAACQSHRAELRRQGWEVQEIADVGHDVIARTDLVLPVLARFLDGLDDGF